MVLVVESEQEHETARLLSSCDDSAHGTKNITPIIITLWDIYAVPAAFLVNYVQPERAKLVCVNRLAL